jgi:hypothetical protein
MRLGGPVLLLATLAALLMAPSSVSAAQPNELRAADVSPSSGLTSKPFTFSVEYGSRAGNPAQSVSLSVAGTTVPLSLVSGTAVGGTWQTTRLLLPGVWAVTFRAQVAKGNQPSLAFGTVEVLDAISPPTAGSSVGPVDSASDGGTGGSSWQPAPQFTPTPVPSSEGAPESRAPRATTSAAPATSGSSTKPATREHPRARRSGSAEPTAAPAGAPRRGSGETTDGPAAPKPGDPPVLWLVLLLGVSGVGVVALLGTAWMLLMARREREIVAAEAADASEPDLAPRTVATIEQRAMRRARLRQADDPILAGLGLDDETTRAASPRRRPGDRPKR